MIASLIDLTLVGTFINGITLIGWRVSRLMDILFDFALAERIPTTLLLAGTIFLNYYGLGVIFGSSDTAYLGDCLLYTFILYLFI